MANHFHVYLGGTHGFMHGEAAFQDAEESISCFLGFVDSMIAESPFDTPRETVEQAFHHAAVNEENEAIYIDSGRVRIVWVACKDACLHYLRN